MKSNKSRLPTLVIGTIVLALVVGVAGSAVAGPDAFTSISKKKTKKIAKQQANKQINKKKPWTTGDIADNAITSNKLQDDSVSTSKLTDESVKSDELGEITKVEETSPPAAVPEISAEADCPNGTKVISGGFEVFSPSDPFDPPIPTGDQRSNNGWEANAIAQNAGDTVTAYAYCLEESD
jgi:hypothetical protein